MDLEVYADGGSHGNHDKNIDSVGGWAWILLADGEEYRHDLGTEFKATNQAMEIWAVAMALEYLAKSPMTLVATASLTIYTDSKYVIDAVNQGWLKNWIAKGYRTSGGKPVANRSLWEYFVEQLRKVEQTISVKFTHVRGHSGNKWNEKADLLVQQAIRARTNVPKDEYTEPNPLNSEKQEEYIGHLHDVAKFLMKNHDEEFEAHIFTLVDIVNRAKKGEIIL